MGPDKIRAIDCDIFHAVLGTFRHSWALPTSIDPLSGDNYSHIYHIPRDVASLSRASENHADIVFFNRLRVVGASNLGREFYKSERDYFLRRQDILLILCGWLNIFTSSYIPYTPIVITPSHRQQLRTEQSTPST